MTVIKVAAEDINCLKIGAGSVDQTAGRFLANYARCALVGGSGLGGTIDNGWQVPLVSAEAGPVYCTFLFHASSGASGASALIFRDGTTPLARLATYSPFLCRLETWNGAAWVSQQASGTFAQPQNLLTRITIRITIGAAGVFQLWSGETLAIDFSGSIEGGASATTFDNILLGGFDTSESTRWSNVIVSDVDNKSHVLAVLVPNGAGAVQDFTVTDFGNINQVVESQANTIQSDTAAQVSTFTLTNLPTGNERVIAVVSCAKAVTDGSSPTEVQVGIRSGGSNDFPAAVGPGMSYTEIETYYNTDNPITAAPWTRSEVDALEQAFQSAS